MRDIAVLAFVILAGTLLGAYLWISALDDRVFVLENIARKYGMTAQHQL